MLSAAGSSPDRVKGVAVGEPRRAADRLITMERRLTPRAIALVAALALWAAACGDDDVDPGSAPDDTLPPPSTTTPAVPEPAAIEHPTGADDVVLKVAFEGGFMPQEAAFTQLPTLLVSGDGRMFVQGPQLAIYPGPLLPNVLVSDIGEDGVQDLLTIASEAGLFTDREYDPPQNVADAPDTVVTINGDGRTFVHRAYALGIVGGPGEGEQDPDRANLQAFVDQVTGDLFDDGGAMGGNPFQPETYLIRVWPVDPTTEYDVEPTVVEWPQAVDVDLAAAAECLEVSAAGLAETFAAANQLTFFAQDGETYQVVVRPALPGDSC